MGNEQNTAVDPLAHSLALYNEWKATWGSPVLHAAYTLKFDEGMKLLAAAKSNSELSTLPEDVSEGISYYVVYLTCRLEWDPRSKGYSKEDYDAVISELNIPAKTKFGEYIRNASLVQFRCNGSSDGFDELTKEEVDKMLSQVPPVMSEPVWHHLARWAFERRDIVILEQAFEHFLLNPPQVMGQARWQRVNMMYQLVSGKATRRDLEESIRVLEIRPQLLGFKETIWPECVKLGLVDAELEEMLAKKEAEVFANEKDPGLERKTKSYFGTNYYS